MLFSETNLTHVFFIIFLAAVADYHEDILGGVDVITMPATREQLESTDEALYKSIDDVPNEIDTQLTLMPYYSWTNRLNGQMRVWLYR